MLRQSAKQITGLRYLFMAGLAESAVVALLKVTAWRRRWL